MTDFQLGIVLLIAATLYTFFVWRAFYKRVIKNNGQSVHEFNMDIIEDYIKSSNPFIQFDFESTDIQDSVISIGSVFGDDSIRPNLKTKPAGQNTLIRDHGGATCVAIQNFNSMVSYNKILVSEIQLISGSSAQLGAQLSHNVVCYDAVKNQRNISQELVEFIIPKFGPAAEEERATCAIYKGEWELSFNKFLEIPILSKNNVTILLRIDSIWDGTKYVKIPA